MKKLAAILGLSLALAGNAHADETGFKLSKGIATGGFAWVALDEEPPEVRRPFNVLAVLAQALVFGLVHFKWGVGGILFGTVMGAVWGFAFLLCGRNLWIVILAHSTAHILLVAQIYGS